MSRRIWIFSRGILIGGGFYLLLIDTTSLPELYVLAAVALACAVGFQLAREKGFADTRIRLGWLAGAWRLAGTIPRDIGVVCFEALAQLFSRRAARGSSRAVPFGAAADTALDAGRRSLTEAFGSLAPNTIVIGVDAERKLLLVHQLRRIGDPDQLDPLRLG